MRGPWDGPRMFPAAVNEWAPSAIHASYFSVTLVLKGLFHATSGAWIYLVQPPGTMTGSIFACASSCLMLSVMWHLRVLSQHPTSKWELAQYSLHLVTSQVFIHPSVYRRGYIALIFKLLIKLLVSLLAPGKTINGFSFIPSAFAVKQTETLDFSCPVVFSQIEFSPALSTVVLDSISCQTAVSSMAIMSLWL